MTLEDLLEVKKESIRFKKRLDKAINRVREDKYALFGCNEIGAVKRAELGLKLELNKLNK